jgi:hypothetical protein
MEQWKGKTSPPRWTVVLYRVPKHNEISVTVKACVNSLNFHVLNHSADIFMSLPIMLSCFHSLDPLHKFLKLNKFVWANFNKIMWSSVQSSWLQIQRSRVRFPALPDFLRSTKSGTGSTRRHEENEELLNER